MFSFRKMARAISYKFIDIGANLTDPMYQGIYHGKSYHPPDLDDVLKRSHDSGVTKIIVTAGSLSDCHAALKLVHEKDQLYCTVGVHPTRCNEFNNEGTTPQEHLEKLLSLALENQTKVVAIGECGLDYDRLHFCNKPTQLEYFEKQLELANRTCLPLFLHCRNAFGDFIDILKRNLNKIHRGGVIHSFDGTVEELKAGLECGFHIGINGCSLKTHNNYQVIKEIPLDRILIETDAPWCEIRPTHYSHKFVQTHFETKKKEHWEETTSVKGRNEPRNIVQVLEVLAAAYNQDKTALAEQIFANTVRLFNI